MHRPLLLSTLSAVVLAAGCGGSGGDPEADPAAIVPARAPVYVEAAIGGDGAEDLDAVGRKLAGVDDVGGELQRLIEREANESAGKDISWKEDVEPWLGDRVALFITAVSADEPFKEGAVVAPTDDPNAAQKFLEGELGQRDAGAPAPKIAERKHRDVSYKVETQGGTAVAIVDEYAVTGTEAAVKAAIDAAEGDSLADADALKKARDQVEDDSLGFAYLRVSSLLSVLGPQGLAARQLLGESGDTIAMTLDVEEDEIRVESAALGVREGGPAGGAGEVLGTLPGDAWAAVGTADIGAQLERTLQQVGQLGAFGGVDVDQILGQVQQQTGIDVREDLIAWMGDGGVFVQGETLSDIGGALVVASKDEQASARLVPKLARVVRQFVPGTRVSELDRPGVDAGITVRSAAIPLPVHVAAAGDRFVIAVTNAALDAALEPENTLADAQAYKDAGARLEDGIEPQFFLDFAPVRSLLEQSGALTGADGEKADRVLGGLTSAVAGSKRDGDVARGRFSVGVK